MPCVSVGEKNGINYDAAHYGLKLSFRKNDLEICVMTWRDVRGRYVISSLFLPIYLYRYIKGPQWGWGGEVGARCVMIFFFFEEKEWYGKIPTK